LRAVFLPHSLASYGGQKDQPTHSCQQFLTHTEPPCNELERIVFCLQYAATGMPPYTRRSEVSTLLTVCHNYGTNGVPPVQTA
jgi:hypothetical protein